VIGFAWNEKETQSFGPKYFGVRMQNRDQNDVEAGTKEARLIIIGSLHPSQV
jgi:hypothetical protein